MKKIIFNKTLTKQFKVSHSTMCNYREEILKNIDKKDNIVVYEDEDYYYLDSSLSAFDHKFKKEFEGVDYSIEYVEYQKANNFKVEFENYYDEKATSSSYSITFSSHRGYGIESTDLILIIYRRPNVKRVVDFKCDVEDFDIMKAIAKKYGFILQDPEIEEE